MSIKKTIKYTCFVLSFVFFVLGVKWGVSNADSLSILDIVKPQEIIAEQNFSAAGIVSNIATIFDTNTYIYMENSSATDGLGRTAFGFSTDQVRKIENTDYLPLTINDIKIGDKIVVQGLLKNGVNIEVYRIISFATTTNKEEKEDSATSTEDTATSTATTTTSEIESSSTSTASTSDVFASSSDDLSSTTEDTNSSTSSSTGILDTISDAVKDIVQTVVDVFSSGSDTTPPAEEVSPSVDQTPTPEPAPEPTPTPEVAPESPAPTPDPAPVSPPNEELIIE